MNDQHPSASDTFRASDVMRGMLITAIVALVGYFAVLPAPAPGHGGFVMTHTGSLMLLVGVAMQLTILVGRPLLARYERARGIEGRLSPVAIHFLQLIADGLTVLLFALAVFGGISRAESGI